MKRKIFITFLISAVLCLPAGVTAYAENESSAEQEMSAESSGQISNSSVDESTNTEFSAAEQSLDNSGQNAEQSIYNSDESLYNEPEESSYTETDDSLPEESPYFEQDESLADESLYTEEAEQASYVNTEASEESPVDGQQSEASSEPILKKDPYSWLSGINTVIPADRSGYISPAQKAENEKAERLYEESRAALEQAAKAERNLLSSPHIPENDIIEDTASVAAENETNSFLIGIIIWSAIGIIITLILIFILRTKAPSKSFTRKP